MKNSKRLVFEKAMNTDEEMVRAIQRGGLKESVILEDHQLEGVRRLFFTGLDEPSLKLFFWGMGTGKTMLTLASLCFYFGIHQNSISCDPCIVVVQSSTIFATWRSHFERFAPQVRVQYVDKESVLLQLDTTFSQVFVITQTMMEKAHSKGWNWNERGESFLDKNGDMRYRGKYQKFVKTETFLEKAFGVVFFDEVQNVKTLRPQNRLRQSLRVLCTGSVKVAGLSGTPIVNKPEDMAGILYALGDNTPFADAKTWGKNGSVNTGTVEKFNMEGYVYRIREDQMNYNLPPLKETFVFIDPTQHVTQAQLEDYNSMFFEAKAKSNKKSKDTFELVLLLNKMVKLVLSWKVASAVSTIVDMLKTHTKVVVTARSVEFLEYVRQALGSEKADVLSGKTSPSKRALMVQRFLKEPHRRLFFLSMLAGGTGLNITPGATGMVILDLWWTSAIHDQVKKRIHRRGQTEPVEVKTLVCTNTVEAAILKLQQDKTFCAEIVLGDEDPQEEEQEEEQEQEQEQEQENGHSKKRKRSSSSTTLLAWKQWNRVLDGCSALSIHDKDDDVIIL